MKGWFMAVTFAVPCGVEVSAARARLARDERISGQIRQTSTFANAAQIQQSCLFEKWLQSISSRIFVF